MTDSFVHLHVHSEYSMLDGASKIDELVEAVARDGQPAVAITDHGNMYGAIPFYKACKAGGVEPIIGTEFYMARHSIDDRPKAKGKKVDDFGGETETGEKMYHHITALAIDTTGYQNMMKLSSEAFIKGFYRKPRIDWDIMAQHSDGIIVTSGCLGGVVLQELLKGDVAAAEAAAGRLQDIFGKDNFFVELQDHGIPEQHQTNPQLIEIARKLNAGLVATNDSHYTHAHDHVAHDALLCQPPTTKVLMADGTEKTIDHVEVGDMVVSYDGSSRRGKLSKQRVSKVAMRDFLGSLIEVETQTGKKSSYTRNHHCIARLDVELSDGEYVVYMMKKGNSYRLGQCAWRRPRSKSRPDWVNYGVMQRAKEQVADAIWVVSAHSTSDEAREQEAWLSHRYGVPTWGFSEGRSPTHSPRKSYYKNLWDRAGDLTGNARGLLAANGRNIGLPLWERGQPALSAKNQVVIRAANLMPGMLVCEPDRARTKRKLMNDGNGTWVPVTKVSAPTHLGFVHSLEVENDHSYVADGIVTHNCIQTGAKIADKDRFRFHGHDHYVKSAQEMRYLFREVPESCDNTLLIAERADIQIDFNQIRMPHFPVPDGFADEEDYLRALVIEGAESKYGALTGKVVDRLEYELDVICQMGFPGYFLITWDLIRHAKSAGILVGPGRGSAGGCAVACCLGITAVDPLEHGLLFERFLNPARISMPDIDIDIDSRYREHMINYCAKTYGEDKVAQIITFGTIKSRQAVRDAARVLDKPFTLGDRIAKALPPLLFGRDTPLRACLTDSEKHHDGYEQAGALRAMYGADSDVREVVDVAMGLENLRRSDGIHAAAVVISPDPLTDYTPVQKKPKGPITTQYEMHAIEDLGLLKEDFLGLTTLDVISDAAKLMYNRHGVELDLINWKIPLDDQPTYDLLRKGDTVGVFQLEGTQMRALLRDLEPSEFGHIAAVLALYRPGPLAANMHIDYAERKTGRAAIEVFHEDAKDMLKETYGLMIYQEQLMDVAQHFAGYSLGDAYLLLKTCAKKLPEAMSKESAKFVSGVIDRGFGEEFAEMLFGMVSEFANYAFNKCATGDTIVIDGHSQERTIAELHRKLHNIKPPTKGRRPKGHNAEPCLECGDKKAKVRGLCNGCYGWHQKFHAEDKGFYLLALEPDGRIRPNRVKDIVHNGQRPVWKVTLDDGRSITTTDNHRHLTTTGYVEVADLKVGDLLVTHEGVDTQSSFTNVMHRTTTGERVTGLGRGPGNFVNGGFTQLREWTKRTPKLCKVNPTHTGRIERAHLDGDRTNNDPSNLAMLCVSCHKKHDYGLGRTKRWGKGHLSGSRRIVSIEPVGVEDVYDIEMATPEHNFVANGIVTHNSHSVGYGLISYWTAYMKANYPAEYMSALMTSVQAKHEKLSIFLSECKKMGLTVEAPSINISDRNFQPVGPDTIVCGFLGIRNVGESPAQAIVEEREANGDFSDFFDYTNRVGPKALNKKVVEALVSSGAFDALGVPRRGLVQVYPEVQEQMKRDAKRIEKLGDLTMFDIEPEVAKIGIPDLHYNQAELLALEKEFLGVYISGHPLAEIQDILDEDITFYIHELKEMDQEQWSRSTIAGIVTNVDNKWTKKGDLMKIFRVEDQTGEIECVLFPRQTKLFGQYVEEDAVVYVNGNPEEDRNGTKILVETVKLYQRALSTSKNVHLWLPDAYPLDDIKQKIRDSHGDGPVTVRYMGRTAILPRNEYLSSVASLRKALLEQAE